MTDEEVNELLPVVDELVAAVAEGDSGFIAECLAYNNRAAAFAVILAQRVLNAEAGMARAQREYVRMQAAVKVGETRRAQLESDLSEAYTDRDNQANKLARYRDKILALGGKP